MWFESGSGIAYRAYAPRTGAKGLQMATKWAVSPEVRKQAYAGSATEARALAHKPLTHEAMVHAVAALGVGILGQDDAKQASAAKLTYGAGQAGLRGVTYYKRWLAGDEVQAFVEICAQGEESPTQLAGTTLHELGHVLAGVGSGHDKGWKEACERLGLRRVMAAGTQYRMSMFDPKIRTQVARLIDRLNDGKPHGHELGYGSLPLGFVGPFMGMHLKPCSAGIGTRGGTSRGAGSGSRLRKYVCAHCGQILRASTDTLRATHDDDGGQFVKA